MSMPRSTAYDEGRPLCDHLRPGPVVKTHVVFLLGEGEFVGDLVNERLRLLQIGQRLREDDLVGESVIVSPATPRYRPSLHRDGAYVEVSIRRASGRPGRPMAVKSVEPWSASHVSSAPSVCVMSYT